MRLVALSDTHGLHLKIKVPAGDVLVFAGDMMNTGYHVYELNDFVDWFLSQPHKHKTLIGGNHDRLLEKQPELAAKFEGCHYLLDSGCEIDGLKFWGSPYTPEFCNWAFNVPRGQLYRHWDLIPRDTHVLVTHGPPYGILDGPYRVLKGRDFENVYLGCHELKGRVQVVNPRAHIFGHIHGTYGRIPPYYNVSVVNDQYRLVNPCTVIDL